MKKGFTLVEILGVIILLGVLTLLILPPFLDSMNENKNSVNEATKKIIYSAADLYISNNNSAFPKNEGSTYCITMNSLVENGLLDEKIYDAEIKDKVDSSTVIKVYVRNSMYQKTLVLGNLCDINIVEPNIDFAIETISGEKYIVMDTYGMNTISSIKTRDDKVVPKNIQNLKVYVSGYNSGNNQDTTNYPTILNNNGYPNYTIVYGTYPTVEYLVNNNYNVFVNNQKNWGVSETVNDYFNAGINLITIGNDSRNLSIINSSTNNASSVQATYTAKVDNNFTKRLGDLSGTAADSRYSVKFINGTQVLYSERANSQDYDAIGYYVKDGTKWIHSQIAIDNIQDFLLGSLDYISNKDTYYYKVSNHGTYNFIITYVDGSTKEVSYNY